MFAISKGPMPTPGYAMTLEGATLSDGVLTVRAQWQTPEPDAVLPQVLTHPCVVVALPVTDAKTLRVTEDGKELARTLL